jgi:hypothetical protein
MGESRDGARFTVEAFAELGVGGQRLGEHFDRDGAIETRVSAFVHLAHAARADLRGNFVDAQPGTGDEGQTCVRGLYRRVTVDREELRRRSARVEDLSRESRGSIERIKVFARMSSIDTFRPVQSRQLK